MTTPIIVYRPLLHLQPLDEFGAYDGAEVDVSCDMSSVEIGVDQPLITVGTFCGKFQVPDDIEESSTWEATINDDTDGRWAPLLGVQVEARVFDRSDHTKFRKFNTEIRVNPSLYGTTQPGEARTVSFDVPVLTAVEWELTGS